MRVEREIPEYVFDNLDNLKAEALAQGYTLKSLAEQCRLSQQTLTGIRSGNLPPARNSYNKIAEVLNWEAWQ